MLDYLRGSFVYVLALLLPLAGVIVAITRFTASERDEGFRLLAASVLGGLVQYRLFVA